jgi:hypothetical protein
MRFSEIVKRLTGFSTPLGGVSWTAPEAEVDVARRVIRFLEDRRVLYNIYELETPQHCVHSVLEIRRFLTVELGRLPDNALAAQLSALRTACHKFLDSIQDVDSLHMFQGGPDEWNFISALGELRGVAGVLVAEIAAKYRLDVEGDLTSIFPASQAPRRSSELEKHQ